MTALPLPAGSPPQLPRQAAVAGAVVLLHAAALWGLQAGLHRAAEVVVPVELLSEIVTPPQVQAPPAPAPAPRPEPRPQVQPEPKPVATPPKPVVRERRPAPAPAPRPAAAPEPALAPAPPVAFPDPNAPSAPAAAPAVPAAPGPATAAAPAAPAAAKVELPTTNADYLRNPPPAYPRMSFRLGEEGTTIVRVLIGTDGRALQAQVARSSGYARLDQAAEATARSWQYVPGKRGGVPEPMWVNVPIKWEIKRN